ncbi:N-acetylmuramoyl-L-alanine amidase family protein [Paenibacillus dakarensis]|uniref:N-acetylmuramoyl-L-alanine amidase family protein n=1 Tax=Paenibacillus dakarensis TaxID=1527293 RepID=UPI0006D591CD|nr:N-acetylmuramoyl-L-alanine amidase family protein [Paenibacillus dakarensis]
MKKLGFLLFLVVFLLVFPKLGDAASTSAKIYLDGEQLNLSSGVKVANVNNSVLIPIRVVSENLGFKVDWEKSSQSVTVQNSMTTVKMVIGSKTALIDGSHVSMNVTPVLSGQTTMVPIRFVSTQMGMDVKWDNQKKAVYLSSSDISKDPWSNGGEGSVPAEPNPETPGTPSNPQVPSVPGTPGSLATVDGISFSDNRLMIATTGYVTPKVFKLDNPNRIVVDLPNTAFSEIFGYEHTLSTQNSGELAVTGYPDVSLIRYALFSDSPSTVRVVINLSNAKNYTVSIDNGLIFIDLNVIDSEITPPVTPPTAPPIGSNGKKLVVIDAGHGGNDPGAGSVTGKREKAVTLAIALKVDALLKKEKNIDVIMTRSGDSTLKLGDRTTFANKAKADIFVSIHGNSNTSSSPSGTETYYTKGKGEASGNLAKTIHKHLIKATGFKDRGVKTADYYVTKYTSMPAVLLEVGFLSNKSDEAQMYKEDFQNRVAQGIVNGIKEYLKVQ